MKKSYVKPCLRCLGLLRLVTLSVSATAVTAADFLPSTPKIFRS